MLFSKHNHSDEPDEILLRRIRDSQDNQAAAALFQRYVPHVLGVCQYYLNHQQDALDAVMDVFAMAVEEIPKTEIRNFKSWLFIISKNHCLQHLKKNGRYRHLFVEINENIEGEAVQNDVDLSLYRGEGEDEINLLTGLLKKLDSRQETCLTMFYFEDKSYQEIAAITGFPPDSMVRITVCSEGSCNALGVLNSRISAPPENPLPLPISTMARIAG
jgi:RNA polymerase sigma-70 factor (ECF subfamily)